MVMTAVRGSALPDSDFEVEGTTPDMDFLWRVDSGDNSQYERDLQTENR